MIRFLAIALASSVSTAALAAPFCTRYDSAHLGRLVEFCIHRSAPHVPAAADEPVVYFFHGLGGSAKSWITNGYAEAVDQLAEREGYLPVTFVSFETEAASYFSDEAGRATGPKAYETWFLKEFMPYVESVFHVCAKRECRATAGVSMGGLGALKTALRHPELFAATAGNSSALAPFNAYEPETKWFEYFDRHPIGRTNGRYLLQSVKNVFRSPAMFDEHDPSWLAARLGAEQMPRLYFDVGARDDFGFEEGYERLRSTLIARGVAFDSELVPDAAHDVFKTQRFPLLRWIRDRGFAK